MKLLIAQGNKYSQSLSQLFEFHYCNLFLHGEVPGLVLVMLHFIDAVLNAVLDAFLDNTLFTYNFQTLCQIISVKGKEPDKWTTPLPRGCQHQRPHKTPKSCTRVPIFKDSKLFLNMCKYNINSVSCCDVFIQVYLCRKL